jgi:hypothetical protein
MPRGSRAVIETLTTRSSAGALVVLALAIGGCGGGSGGTAGEGNRGDGSSLGTCPAGALFSVSPMRLGDFNSVYGIAPLGNLNPSGHTFPTVHIYLFIRDANGPPTPPVQNVPVYAPAAITITQISSSQDFTAGFSDYGLHFQPCDQLQGYFYHLPSISSALQTAFDAVTGNCQDYVTGGHSFRYCNKDVSVRVEAGAQIGTAGGPGTGSVALDFGARDGRIAKLTYANSARIREDPDHGFDDFHVVCPIDYYEEGTRALLEAKLNRVARAIPLCGTVAQDIAGTAQGKWYLAGTASPTTGEDDQIALVHDNVDPAKPVFSVGNARLGTGRYFFTVRSSGLVNRDFGDVAADGNIRCFDSLSGASGAGSAVFLVQLTSPTALMIEKQTAARCGTGPWVFTASAMSFER